MKRRDLFASLALAGFEMSTAAAQGEPESLYIPRAHRVEDRQFLHDFMDEFSFIELVTCAPEIRITHIPVVLDRSNGTFGTLHGHISRQNPQAKTFDGQHSAVVVFRGPDSYISPAWYSKSEAVPTWNFAVVHASGKPTAITEKKPLNDLLAKLIAKYEKYQQSSYDFSKLSDGYKYGLMAGVIGFEMRIEQLEGKFKLGQERSEPDRKSVLRHLQSARQPPSIHDFTASFYQRVNTAK